MRYRTDNIIIALHVKPTIDWHYGTSSQAYFGDQTNTDIWGYYSKQLCVRCCHITLIKTSVSAQKCLLYSELAQICEFMGDINVTFLYMNICCNTLCSSALKNTLLLNDFVYCR